MPILAVLAAALWLAVEMVRGGMPWTPAFLLSLSAFGYLYSVHKNRLLDERPRWAIFWAALALYLSSFRWHGGDDIPNSILPIAILRHHTLALDPVLHPWLTGKAAGFTVLAGGRTLSVFSVAPAILATPLYVIPVLCGAPISEAFLHNLSKIAASLMTTGSAVAFFLAVSQKCSKRWALSLTAFYALGTSAFSVASQALYEHGPAQLGLALGLWGLCETGPACNVLAGAGFAWAVACRLDSALFATAAGLFLMFRQTRRLPGFALGAAPPLILLFSYYWRYTGSLWPPEMAAHSRHLQGLHLEPAAALLVSPLRGLFLFSPFVFFGAWGAFRGKRPSPAPWLLAACAADYVVVIHYDAWPGGMTFGSRFLASISLVMAFLCADLEEDIRNRPRLLTFWSAAGAFSMLVNALGAYFIWPGSYSFEIERLQMWQWGIHPVAQLFASPGLLGELPGAVRLLLGAGIIALAGLGWVHLNRRLSLDATSTTR